MPGDDIVVLPFMAWMFRMSLSVVMVGGHNSRTCVMFSLLKVGTATCLSKCTTREKKNVLPLPSTDSHQAEPFMM